MMRILRTFFIATLSVALGASGLAGQGRDSTLAVRTFALRFMRSSSAAQLVSPYVRSAQGGVFEVGGSRSITVRERPEVIATIDSVLRVHDRAPDAVRLRFQLIATSDSSMRDTSIASVEKALRELFRFRGYRMVAQGSSIVSEYEEFRLTMVADEQRYELAGSVWMVDPNGSGVVRLTVSLREGGRGLPGSTVQANVNSVLSTGLTFPLGQTVVLGSGSPTRGGQVLILVVHPELQPPVGR